MDTWIWIAVVFLLVVLLLRIVGRQAIRGRVDPTDLLLEPELVERVRTLARANQQAAAIRLLREHNPGLGLAPAKLIVDRMTAAKQAPAAAAPVPLEVELHVRTLKSDGNLTEAIELVRDHTGWDRSAAASYVDDL